MDPASAHNRRGSGRGKREVNMPDTPDLYDLLAQIRDVLTERLPETKPEPQSKECCGVHMNVKCPCAWQKPKPEPEPKPLAEPKYLGAAVVDADGEPWVRSRYGYWANEDGGRRWVNLVYDFAPLRLPTPAERTEWGMPRVLGEGEVAVKTLTPPGMAETWRSYADHADERGCLREVGEMLRHVADALDAAEGQG